MKNIILKHSILNAIQHNGKADVQAVLGKVIAENPELKNKIKEVILEIKKIIKKVNSWPLQKQKEELDKLGVVIEEKKVEKFGLPELPNVKEKVILRLAPFPSGPLHIGNARMIVLNDEYKKKYGGKLLLVIDDTIGSEEKFIVPEAYDLILDGIKWLGVKWDEIYYKSDRLELFYNNVEEMIKRNLVYICECDAKTLRKNRAEGIECKHRNESLELTLKKWNDMLAGKYKEGEAVVRLKTDMKHENPAFRDRVLLRVVEREHPRVGKKYRVWPMLEFSWAVDDHLLGITHIIRGKDLVMEDMMEEFIWNKMGWKKVEFVHYGMLNIKEAKLSKTEARKAIESGEYSGWDDPRTWSLQSLRKRGIRPEAIRRFIINMGLSQADVSIPAEILYAENRKIIDPIANRYFVVLEPVEISIRNPPIIKEVDSYLHPDFPERGKRKIPVNIKKIFVEKSDLKKFKNKEIRLMDLFNIKLNKHPKFTSKEMKLEMQKIQWVSEPNVKIKIVMPDGVVKNGIAEPEVKNLKINDIIQAVRIGFMRLDKIENDTMIFYFAHK